MEVNEYYRRGGGEIVLAVEMNYFKKSERASWREHNESRNYVYDEFWWNYDKTEQRIKNWIVLMEIRDYRLPKQIHQGKSPGRKRDLTRNEGSRLWI